MIIDKASINLNNQHQYQEKREEKESLRLNRPNTANIQENTRLSAEFQQIKQQFSSSSINIQVDNTEHQLTAQESMEIQLIKVLFKQITGRYFKLFHPEQLKNDVEQIEFDTPAPPANTSPRTSLTYQHTLNYEEKESSHFSAQGQITTKDGKTIDFSAQLNMSRSFQQQTNLQINMGNTEKIDPLVINFEGNAAELSSTYFEFDIDADGNTEQIATLTPNSGFLALDKNQDGIINDGNELFGPQTGQGFSELAQYDEDNNNFIDEADSIYQSLRIWQHNEDGSQTLFALSEKNIGAIYLGHVSTPFQLKTTDNESLGEIKNSSIYINEDGSIGTIQEIDFTV